MLMSLMKKEYNGNYPLLEAIKNNNDNIVILLLNYNKKLIVSINENDFLTPM
ncbi:hypothetical protein BCR32DRAFT_288009 [Anaeromyces robustus]|uniref:Ankyrin n=1 Tax=Anaeromyces robustus TaxID=1754192 RepID=A0A1Y1VPH5_9FUNG|nr:hypothetical protein BCR32DRAFT_288009 [Anaeromyces robustus]|eukprot:ORX61827.1 hypothetical protein BCR32DRAFT_288009 [Anaeromyces robustus]